MIKFFYKIIIIYECMMMMPYLCYDASMLVMLLLKSDVIHDDFKFNFF